MTTIFVASEAPDMLGTARLRKAMNAPQCATAPRVTAPLVDDKNHLWAIILAAGEGKRLAPLTRTLYGWELPKQFASIDVGRSLLQETMHRVASLVPPERTVVVVGQSHERLAKLQLREHEGVEIVVQPKNLDTGPGILLPLTHVLSRDPDATVILLPSDHYIPEPKGFLSAVKMAVESSRTISDPITLLGVVPHCAETEYGWIVPGNSFGGGTQDGLRVVSRFVEKPPLQEARKLLRHGGLWNTFISIGLAATYWELAKRHLPDQAALFELYRLEIHHPERETFLRSMYADMKPANFSREVLERAENLAVLPVSGIGWSDWGNPQRIFRSLKGTARLERLRGRMMTSAAESRALFHAARVIRGDAERWVAHST
jgi:mannose-1-phosphate guanylyltransferase